jgi:hypothetical protein
MSGPQYFDNPDDSDVVIPEQPPISVYTNEAGAIVIKQFQWEEGDVFVFVLPHNAVALCKGILEAAEVDADAIQNDVTVKDATAKERQRRHREKLRDCHAQKSVTVTAELANDADGRLQESGSTTAG